MDQFEKLDENITVTSDVVENAMSTATASTTPVNQVDDLISQVAAEHGLKIAEQLSTATPSNKIAASTTESNELEARLAKLKTLA
jgi:charged multivesicular body protein 1